MEAFEVEQIKLFGHYDTDTGKVRTASVYWVDGIDRALSLAELVMAVCLERAAFMETKIVELMDEMQQTNIVINGLTKVEALLVQIQDKDLNGNTFNDIVDPALTDEQKKDSIPEDANLNSNFLEWLTALPDNAKVTLPKDITTSSTSMKAAQVQELVQNIESKLDNLNSYSQQKMIELQSETNKRNQAFDLISSMVKSISTANQSIGANYR